MLDQRNHYNKSLNKCFVLVEYHFHNEEGNGSWTNDMSLWDMYENAEVGTFSEIHMISWEPKHEIKVEVITCELSGEKCDGIEKFNELVRPYLNN